MMKAATNSKKKLAMMMGTSFLAMVYHSTTGKISLYQP